MGRQCAANAARLRRMILCGASERVGSFWAELISEARVLNRGCPSVLASKF
jgi:hypothetical protein